MPNPLMKAFSTTSNYMVCLRCQGLMVPDWFMELLDKIAVRSTAKDGAVSIAEISWTLSSGKTKPVGWSRPRQLL